MLVSPHLHNVNHFEYEFDSGIADSVLPLSWHLECPGSHVVVGHTLTCRDEDDEVENKVRSDIKYQI